MIYLGIGICSPITSSEAMFLQEIGYYLARTGRVLRTGGFGEVDDNLISGALTFCKEQNIPSKSRVELILPFSKYRHHELNNEYIYSFSRLDEDVRVKSRVLSSAYYGKKGAHSQFKTQMLSCGAVLVNGMDLNSPVRFAITHDRGVSEQDTQASSVFLQNIYKQLYKDGTLVFNLADRAHRERMITFVRKEKGADILPTSPEQFIKN